MEYTKLQDKCRGSLVGGAVGDALGYEVEFMSLESILHRFGENGITRYVPHSGVAQFSDDTQMTLFTAEGLLNGVVATNAGTLEEILPSIRQAYLAWYKTQTEQPKTIPGSRLSCIRTLWARRAPGNTCMSALRNLAAGYDCRNNSKGCGGVMRVAPIGIFIAAHPHIYSSKDVAVLAGMAAELTHHHISSTFASALLAMIVEKCILEENVSQQDFEHIISDCLVSLQEYFPGHDYHLSAFAELIHRALKFAKSDVPEREAIRRLGEGWVGDEAIAIAIFCVMRHIDNFEQCIVCAVNHNGDSDSTGAIAGNIIGAILGYSAIPGHYLEALEIHLVLVSMADDLCADLR